MSVIKNKRSLSDLEFYRNAILLRKNLTLLMLRDFGVKNKVRDTVAVTKDMTKDDAKIFEQLVKKYNQVNILDEFPKWIIDRMRSNVLDILFDLVKNIIQANTIYPVYESEYYERRNFQNRAIANCEDLLQEMQYIISIIPTDINKYIQYTDTIEKEIALLKGWRKSDNKILRRIKNPKEKSKSKDFKDEKNKESKDKIKTENTNENTKYNK